MKLIESLASGVTLAAVGTVILNSRGTSTRAQYYRDFEASQVYTVQPIALDSSGSAVVYVNELVDVLVYDASGTLVREFVAGDSAPAVEVISRSFTGTSYSDGSSGASKPTTLQAVLDKWLASAGTTDFNVIPTGGTSITLAAATAALQGLFFNVKTYGAIGNGVADDSAAIGAAYTAAAATSTGGGTVFFPPGTYRCAAGIVIPGGVATLGSGGSASKIRFDGAALSITFNVTATLTMFQGMDVGCQTTHNFSRLLTVLASGRLHILDCVLGGDNFCDGGLIGLFGSYSNDTETTIERTRFTSNSSVSTSIQLNTSGEQVIRVVDCDFINNQLAAVTHIQACNGMVVRGCRFDVSGISSGVPVYLTFDGSASPTHIMAPIAFGNYFAATGGIFAIAFQNTGATPNRDFIEYGNTFGAPLTLGVAGITPYSYTTDGYYPYLNTGGFHGSRQHAREHLLAGATINASPKTYGMTVISQTAGAAIALNATLGSPGDVWTLMVINTTGGAVTVTPNGAQIVLDAAAASFAVASGGRSTKTFAWLPVVGGGTPGRWTQIAPGTNI